VVASWLVVGLLIASPGAAFAQSAVEGQYSDPPTDQYSNGGVQQTPRQAPGGPGDPVNPGSSASSAPSPSQTASPAPSPSQTDPSQVPVGPSDPAYPEPAPQPPETFEQALAGTLSDLNTISQSTAPPGTAQDPNASLPAPTAPASLVLGGTGTVAVPVTNDPTAVVGGASSGQPSVAVVNPFSAITSATSVGDACSEPVSSPGTMVLGGSPNPLCGTEVQDGQGNACGFYDRFGVLQGSCPSAPSSMTIGGSTPSTTAGSEMPSSEEGEGMLKAVANLLAGNSSMLLPRTQPQGQTTSNWIYDNGKDGVDDEGAPASEELEPSGQPDPTNTKDDFTGE